MRYAATSTAAGNGDTVSGCGNADAQPTGFIARRKRARAGETILIQRRRAQAMHQLASFGNDSLQICN